MLTNFAHDLSVARDKSGLSQKEVASLLAIDQSTYSDLERGKKPPSVQQVCQLSLIYGRNFRSLFKEMVAAVKPDMQLRIENLSASLGPRFTASNRAHTLRQMGHRIGLADAEYGGA